MIFFLFYSRTKGFFIKFCWFFFMLSLWFSSIFHVFIFKSMHIYNKNNKKDNNFVTYWTAYMHAQAVKKLILPYFVLDFKVVGIPYTLLKFRKSPRVAQHTTNWPQHQCYGYRPTGLAQVIWRKHFFNKLLKFNLTIFFLEFRNHELGRFPNQTNRARRIC